MAFEGLFYGLRARGVPVAMDEWLGLQEALARGLADSSLSRFYLLARALLVKSERHYDDYDLAFAEYLSGLEQADDAIADRVWEWLDERPEAFALTAEQRARLGESLDRIDLDALRERLAERLRNQTEAHRGGSRHIGTGGTSPFGHSGWHPGGIRIGGEGRNRTAAQIAAERRFREYRGDETIGVREMGVALRRLRRLTTRLDGPATELDLDDTIDATADAGGNLRLVFRRPRRNAVRVLLLLDVGGSMDEHASMVNRLFSAVHQGGRFRALTVRYFHNCVYDRLYDSARLLPSHSESNPGSAGAPRARHQAGGRRRRLHGAERAHDARRGDRLAPAQRGSRVGLARAAGAPLRGPGVAQPGSRGRVAHGPRGPHAGRRPDDLPHVRALAGWPRRRRGRADGRRSRLSAAPRRARRGAAGVGFRDPLHPPTQRFPTRCRSPTTA